MSIQTSDRKISMKNYNPDAALQNLAKFRIYHIPFWVLYALFWSFTFSPGISFLQAFLNSLIILLFHVLVSYLNNYYLMNWFLLKRQYISYLLSLMLSISAVYFPIALVYYLIISGDSTASQQVWSVRFFMINSFSVILTIAITASLKLLKDYYQNERRNRELVQINSNTELKFLKGQINPHFLFNSLNNLYGLTLKKSDLAPDFVLKLSGLLRYVLYDTAEGKVSLDKEVEYLQNYIDLERIRLGDRGTITLTTKGDFSQKQIEPMMLIPFLENSIKHGVNSLAKDAWIKINVQLNENDFDFQVENNKPAVKNLSLTNQPGGIGIENTKKRLSILYPNSHELSVVEKETTYFVQLKLVL